MLKTTLSELLPQFDAIFVDQFGVLMDADGPYPEAIETLKEISLLEKSVYILSNSGKRAAQNKDRLKRLGFDPKSFDGIITSGELAYFSLKKNPNDTPAGLLVYYISRDNDTSVLEGLRYNIVEDSSLANLIVIAGSMSETVCLSEYKKILSKAATRGVPAICTNPDLRMLSSKGITFGAGAIANAYSDMGGRVTWFGKPHIGIYEFALSKLSNIPRSRILCIGDSLEHDVRGAKNFGCPVALVRSGLSKNLDIESIVQRSVSTDVPDYLIDNFLVK